MKILLISWMLLVLGVTLNSGHYIYKVEKQDAPAYEVESNPKGLVLVNTKLEKPTLKDILFHDLLERFFGKEEPLITERAFTNSHGLPFLEELDNENESGKGDYELFEEAEPKPLTDEAVKEAYKSKSYLFDQMRQRNDAISPDLLERKKRQSEIPYFPEASQISPNSYQDPFAPPKTYGMNLNPNGGYVWNNLNNRPSLYELGQSPNGYENAFQNQPQTSEAPAPEEYASSTPENLDSASSEDIYVNINKPTALPLENEEELEFNEPRVIPENNESEAENPIAPNDNSDSFETRDPAESVLSEVKPDEPEARALEIPESPVESVSELNSQEAKQDEAEPAPVHEDNVEMEKEIPAESSSVVPVEDVNSEPAENSHGDKIKEMPEAPTLPPLNYDSLPDYIRQSISSTERPEYEQTENPFFNPQPSSEDKKEMEDKIEDNLTTAQPMEDIPKTYGMNLTSGSGRVWNDLVNPPVSYEVGSTGSNQSEEPKEFTTPAPATIKEPVTAEEQPTVPENPAEEPEDKEPTYPEENIAPIDISAVTEQPENASIEPDVTLPTETADEEINPNTELPESASTTETLGTSESTEPFGNVPETEANNEDYNANTELPESASTTETLGTSESTEPFVNVSETEANNEENNANTELPEIIEALETQVPEIEPVTEELPNADLPEIISTTEQIESINEDDEENKPNDDIAPVEPVIPVTPAEEPENPGTEEPESGSGEVGDEVAEPEEIPDDANEKPDIMSELLKSEQFWKWLGEWTVTYTELMEKHIRKIAIQEICNSRQGVDMCPLDKPEDSGSIIKDGKVTIDGKEIDLNDNVNQLRRGNKGNSGNNVDATTIYGNSVGNDKVTNVFIFNPNNAKDILEGLKPANYSKVNIIIEDKNEVKPEPDQNKEITEDAGIADRGDGNVKEEIPEVEVKEVTEEPVKAIGKSDDNKDEIVSGVKEVEKDTVADEPKDENIEVANVKEVKPDSRELGIENVTEAKVKSEIQ